MLYTLAHQQYKYEHGISAAEQRAADAHAGEVAAAFRDLGVTLGRAFRLRQPVRPARRAADTVTGGRPAASARVLSGAR